MSGLAEQILLYRIRTQRDPKAFAQVYQTYAKPISRFIGLKVGGKEVVEDLTADAFIKAWQYLQRAPKVGNLKALMYQIARTVVVDHYRKTGSKAVVSLEDEEGVLVEPLDIRSEELPDKVDVQLLVGRMAELRNDYRDVLVLKYVEKLDADQIAEVMQTTSGNVRVMAHRAVAALKSLFNA